ncbi:serine/threonine-protein kinase [Microbispora bryophytorum]|uniref:serine/threonine-protein kinase n=1 Tax=Microbispora bryophytorum TaxID=1460882 RepID=UPI0033DEB9A2
MAAPLEPDDPRTLGGFRLGGRLGEGGQGVVYLGYTPDGAPVAVKVLKTGLDPAVRARLTRELDVLRGVAPFCTARVITAMVDGREPYVVSEFVDGPSLQQRVTASGPLRGGELERLAVGTATALAAIHGAGIVHRDFKPGNVLLGPDGPRVVDFGIARQDESETMTTGPVGTPAYLAPEQIARPGSGRGRRCRGGSRDHRRAAGPAPGRDVRRPVPHALASAPAQSTYATGPTPTAPATTGAEPGGTGGTDPATASAPSGIPQAFEGKWRGHIAPTVGLLTSEYDIETELKSGKPSGRWKEPANSCEGTLRLTAASGSALRFRLEDVPQCVPGDVVLTREGDALAYRHTDDLGLFAYEGTLTRDS